LGVNFTRASRVDFNGVPAAFTVENDSTIHAPVPSGTVAPRIASSADGPITVVVPGGSATSDSSFHVGPLRIGHPGINLSWADCGYVYDVGFASPDRARLIVQYAVPASLGGPLDAETEYYAFKVNVQRSNTTGAGSCAGCDVPACILLNSIQLFQDPALAFDPVLTSPVDGNFVTWQDAKLNCAQSTPVQVSTVSAEAWSDQVQIVWETDAVDVATVYRKAGSDPWRAVAHVVPDGSHRIRHVDREVAPGATYGYRLGIAREGGEAFLGETSVTVPAAAKLALMRVAWERSAAGLTVSLSVPRSTPATLEICDLIGRRWAAQRLEGLAPGE